MECASHRRIYSSSDIEDGNQESTNGRNNVNRPQGEICKSGHDDAHSASSRALGEQGTTKRGDAKQGGNRMSTVFSIPSDLQQAWHSGIRPTLDDCIKSDALTDRNVAMLYTMFALSEVARSSYN